MSKLCINECIPYVQKYEWGKGKDGLVYEVMKNIVQENHNIIKKEIDHLEYLKEYMDEYEDNKDEKKKGKDHEEEVDKNGDVKNEEEKNGKDKKKKKKGKKSIEKDEVNQMNDDNNKNNDNNNNKNNDNNNNNKNNDDNNNKNNDDNNNKNNDKYAELWIGNHVKSPNLVVYKNSLVKIEEFLKIYEKKKNKKSKLMKFFYKKVGNSKSKYTNKKKDSTKSEDIINKNNNTTKGSTVGGENDLKRYSDIEFSSLNNVSIKEKEDINEQEELLEEEVDKNTLFPYLFKMLSISKPLSIQIHPNEQQTLYLNTMNPLLYKDKIFKTEMCVCINSMTLLCGFMNIFKIAFLIRNIKELNDFFLKRGCQQLTQGCDITQQNKMDETKFAKKCPNEIILMDDKNCNMKDDTKGITNITLEGTNYNNNNIKKENKVESSVEIALITQLLSSTPSVPSSCGNINVDSKEDEKKDMFHLFDLFYSNKDDHVEEVLSMLSRIYIYIINYALKRGNGLSYDVISVIDNYAECIQKYVYDENFYSSFYKNEKFLELNINLGNLIKIEKEKLQNSLYENKFNTDLTESDMDEEEKDEKTISEDDGAMDSYDVLKKKDKKKGSQEYDKGVDNNNDQLDKQKNDDDGTKVCEKECSPRCSNEYTNTYSNECVNVYNNLNKQNDPYFISRKKIKAFYEHMYKFLIYRILLVENDVLNDCVTSIIKENEKYQTFINDDETFKKKTEKLYADICKKKNYENLCKETENFIIHSIFELLKNVSMYYANDGGRIFLFILQLINLNHGDVVYIKPGVIHSYISGHCLECMTNSDLVIRGGLTNKEIDKLNFIKYVNYKNNYPIILEKEFINYNIMSYSYHRMKHFKILCITIRPGETINYVFSEKSFTSCIVLSTNKKVKIKGKKNDKIKANIKNVRKGMILFIAPTVMVTISNLYANPEDGNKEFVIYCATS
ncbi:mannose-6-phosphate isomerase, putative [Plasmodium sp. DRC-Itaito]|nr:mannose-6-phosphate isomerase, putative [Plasmodium sp. DRC-Itaito]